MMINFQEKSSVTFTFLPLSRAISEGPISLIFQEKTEVFCRRTIQSFRYYLSDNLEDKEYSQVISSYLKMSKINLTCTFLLGWSYLCIKFKLLNVCKQFYPVWICDIQFLCVLNTTIEGVNKEDILKGRQISNNKTRYVKVEQDKSVRENIVPYCNNNKIIPPPLILLAILVGVLFFSLFRTDFFTDKSLSTLILS